MASSTALAINVNVRKTLPYDPRKDITPIALIARMPYALVVNPDLPVRSVADLVKLAKDKPRQLSFASVGPGTMHHLNGELFKSTFGVDVVHVPYKGTAPALQDVVGGHVQFMKEWSSRCISPEAQVSPLSIHITLSFGKRTGRPLMTQLVMASISAACAEPAAISRASAATSARIDSPLIRAPSPSLCRSSSPQASRDAGSAPVPRRADVRRWRRSPRRSWSAATPLAA